MLQELKKLQSGTDIRGIAIEHEGIKNFVVGKNIVMY